MGDLQDLQAEADQIQGLIAEANKALNMPTSNLKEDFKKEIQAAAPKIAVQLQKAVNKGRIEETVIAGAILGVAYVGACGIDVIRNAQASKKARQALLGYYQELIVKHNLVIEEQKKILKELNSSNNMLQEKRDSLQKKYDQLEAICERITKAEESKTV